MQKVDDDKGMFGYLEADVTKEAKRAARLVRNHFFLLIFYLIVKI